MGNNEKKARQLGVPHGTAANQLRKLILFSLLKELGRNVCYRCSRTIETVEELSMEHKEPWLDTANPVDRFFDLSNVAFSHLSCNAAASRKPNAYQTEAERLEASRASWRRSSKKYCTLDVRRKKYLDHGY